MIPLRKVLVFNGIILDFGDLGLDRTIGVTELHIILLTFQPGQASGDRIMYECETKGKRSAK